MATEYLGSDKISVFPSANRSYDYRGARYTNEHNITGIVKSVVGNTSYVIDGFDGSNIRFVINGYYFSADLSPLLTDSFSQLTDVWAQIQISNYADSLGMYLAGTDVVTGGVSKYEGVVFLDSEPSDSAGYYKLHLLTKNGSSWEIPKNSLKMYNLTQSFGVVQEIDGGNVGENGLVP